MRGKPPAPLKSSIFRTCMSKITDIINKYTVGVATLEETNAAAIANGYGLYLVGVPGGRFRPLQNGQLYGVREPVQSFLPRPGYPDPV